MATILTDGSTEQIENMILISEDVKRDLSKVSKYEQSLEMSDNKYTNDLSIALKKHCKELTIYSGPKELLNAAKNHSGSLVMTIWGGENSRNRMALVPAVCESANIPFMGADVYARIICQDKYLCKAFAKRIGIPSAKDALIENKEDIPILRFLSLPLVIKPNMEGSSIGISSSSLVYSFEDAEKQACECLDKLRQPVLVEEFLPGREVSICIAGAKSKITHFQAIEDINITEKDFFNDKLYAYELKSKYYNNFSHQIVTDEIGISLKDKIVELFKKLGKVDYLRVDGKLINGEFYLIELTPDPFLAESSAFAKSFTSTGISYKDAIKCLINTAALNY